VLEAETEAETWFRANVGRGVHRLGRIATHKYQDARKQVAAFLGGENGTLAFTKNTTEAVNIVSQGLPWRKTDRIIAAVQEHHSNLLPWYRLVNEGRIAGVDLLENPGPEELDALITKDTRLVALAHASNVLGTIAPAQEIAEICREHNVLFLLDGAQTAPHLPLNLEKTGCDFFCFSGHKMLGPMGTGGLWISPDTTGEPVPLLTGGGMVASVEGPEYATATAPAKYEAGTPNVIGAIGLARAVQYLTDLGMEQVAAHSSALAHRMMQGLSGIRGVTVFTPEGRPLTGTVSFTVEGLHPHEVAYFLDEAAGIMVRSGEHCCQPLMKSLSLDGGTVRASAYCYNTEDDIDLLVATVEEIAGMVK
jgi:cysteine desulfurase/selenocysteine lyase